MADEERDDETVEEPRQAFGVGAGGRGGGGSVHVDTGRGATAEVEVGAPFCETIERIADQANYGGYFRVFLNGEEIIDPQESPLTIEEGMRIAVTSYDKVGLA